MDNNLILSLIIIEADLLVKDTSEMHSMDPSVEDHIIYFTNFNIQIPLFLHGVFSYFFPSKTSATTIELSDEIYLKTPKRFMEPRIRCIRKEWKNIMDWEGNIIEEQDRIQVMLENVDIDQPVISSAIISIT